MHHLFAASLAVQSALDRLDLAADAAHPRQKLLLVPDGVGHDGDIAYPSTLYKLPIVMLSRPCVAEHRGQIFQLRRAAVAASGGSLGGASCEILWLCPCWRLRDS